MSAAADTDWNNAAPDRAPATELVFGIGPTGLSIARHLQREGITARYFDTRTAPPALDELNELDPGADIVLGEYQADVLQGLSRVIVSPGIPDRQPLLVAARDAGIDVVSDVELFARAANAPIVGITGTNGKSTVTTLLARMCESAGVTAHAGGNLGVPALDLLDRAIPDFYLLELSSFQLQRTRHLPLAVAVLLNVSPDHLDWHGSIAEYLDAKLRIMQEAAAVVINREDPALAESIPAGAECTRFGLDRADDGDFGILGDGAAMSLALGESSLLPVDKIAMVGAHNRANALAALAAGSQMGLDLSTMLRVLTVFPGLPHRMQFVARIDDVEYINDSKATNVGAAIASVNSIAGPVILIAGGQGKGGDFDALASAVGGKLRLAVLFGEDKAAMESAFAPHVATAMETDLRAAICRASGHAEPGDTILLAPACASFDQYPNFQIRGDDFAAIVRELGA